MVSKYGCKLKMGDFYYKRAFLQGEKWNPFHNFDIKTKLYMFCVLGDDPLQRICLFHVSKHANVLLWKLLKCKQTRFIMLWLKSSIMIF